MRYIKDLHEGETIRNVYLCKGKRSAETRNGKPYDNLRREHWMEKYGIRILRGSQSMMRRISSKYLVM